MLFRLRLSVHQEDKHFFWSMNTYDQGLFDIGGPAGAGSEGNEAGQVLLIFFFEGQEAVFQIIHDLVGIGYTYVYRSVDADGSAAWAGCAHDDAAGSGDEEFAGCNSGVTACEVDNTGVKTGGATFSGPAGLCACAGVVETGFQDCLQAFFAAVQLFPFPLLCETLDLCEQLGMVLSENKLALELGELFGKFDFGVLRGRLEHGVIAFTLWKRKRR